jgi:hypothetical protein
MKLAVIALLVHPLLILGPSGLFAATDWGAKAESNPGPHGFSQIDWPHRARRRGRGSHFLLREEAAHCRARGTVIKAVRRPPAFKAIRPPSRIWRLGRRLAVDAPAPQQAVVKFATATFLTLVESLRASAMGGAFPFVFRPTPASAPRASTFLSLSASSNISILI